MDKPKSVREIMLSQMKSTPATAGTTRALGFIWLQAVAKATGEFVPPLTQKQSGQFKHLIARAPEGHAAEIVKFAVANWAEFSKRAESAAGLKTSPDQPNIDFLLKHIGVAANMYLSDKPEPVAEIPDAPIAPNPVQLIANPEPDDAQPASLAELMSILGDGHD